MKTWNFGYKKCLEKAKNIYSQIGRISSPALNNNINFTSIGFNHLIRKGRIPRTRNEQKRRFVLIPLIEKILKNPKAIIEYRKSDIKYLSNRHGNKILITSTAQFWTFVEKIDDCQIKVVIRQINESELHFFSIMGDKVKISKGKRLHKKSP